MSLLLGEIREVVARNHAGFPERVSGDGGCSDSNVFDERVSRRQEVAGNRYRAALADERQRRDLCAPSFLDETVREAAHRGSHEDILCACASDPATPAAAGFATAGRASGAAPACDRRCSGRGYNNDVGSAFDACGSSSGHSGSFARVALKLASEPRLPHPCRMASAKTIQGRPRLEPTHTLSPAEVRRVAAHAGVDPRTVERYFSEDAMTSTTLDRIERALREVGGLVE
jgi:hypothetical protein